MIIDGKILPITFDWLSTAELVQAFDREQPGFAVTFSNHFYAERFSPDRPDPIVMHDDVVKFIVHGRIFESGDQS